MRGFPTELQSTRGAVAREKKSSFSTFWKEPSKADDATLYDQRKGSIVLWSRSPFEELPKPKKPPKEKFIYSDDELKTYVSELTWSDVLLDFAMTATFASLTEGTPIMKGLDIPSHCSFFALVWWIWASQVAYNVGFRQSDWLHRLFVLLQLLVFCILATFTKSFDVTNGLINNTKEHSILINLKSQGYSSPQDIAVEDYRPHRIATLNARGISMTIAFSRVVLLAQYLIALFHASRTQLACGENRRVKTTAFFVHIGSLIFSTTCYFIAYFVIGNDPNRTDQIVKIILWYFPLLVEVAAHFVAASVPGRVRYSPKAIYERSYTVFIIILGSSLDKITNGFQYIVGNMSLGLGSLALIPCAAIIFILIFTLYFSTSGGDKADNYFRTSGSDKDGNRRFLASFFFEFFFLASLIVTLQGISQMLATSNIAAAMEIPFQFFRTSSSLIFSKGSGVHLNESDYSTGEFHDLNNTGVALSTLLDWINNDNSTVAYHNMLQVDVNLMMIVLGNVHADLDPNSILYNKMLGFLETDSMDPVASNDTFREIAEMIIKDNATPALWFYAAGGMILITLALNKLVTSLPRDKYEWGQTISRLLMGSLVIALTALDVNASSDILNADLTYKGSKIWSFTTHSKILIPYTLALVVEQVIELCLLYKAVRTYNSERGEHGHLLLFGLTPTGNSENVQEVEIHKNLRDQPEYNVPFENHAKGKGQILMSSPTASTPLGSTYS